MATRQDLNAKITELQESVNQDIAQVGQLIAKVQVLIDHINQTPQAADFAAEIAAIEAVKTSLTSDNAAVQAAVDAAIPQTPQS